MKYIISRVILFFILRLRLKLPFRYEMELHHFGNLQDWQIDWDQNNQILFYTGLEDNEVGNLKEHNPDEETN